MVTLEKDSEILSDDCEEVTEEKEEAAENEEHDNIGEDGKPLLAGRPKPAGKAKACGGAAGAGRGRNKGGKGKGKSKSCVKANKADVPELDPNDAANWKKCNCCDKWMLVAFFNSDQGKCKKCNNDIRSWNRYLQVQNCVDQISKMEREDPQALKALRKEFLKHRADEQKKTRSTRSLSWNL